MTTSEDILKLHKKKVPIIIQLTENSNIELDKLKYIVPTDVKWSRVILVILKYNPHSEGR